MTSDFSSESEIPADTVYILAKQGHKVSHNTRVEWFIGNINRRIVFPASGACAQLVDRNSDYAPDDWSSLSIAAVLPKPVQPSVFPLVYRIHPHTTVKYLAHCHRITFVLDLSVSMFHPCPSGFSALHHAIVSLETLLFKLIPPSSSLALPLPNSFLTPLSIFISIIGVVPNRQSFTLIHDWEASLEGVRPIITAVIQRLCQLETTDILTELDSSPSASALVDMLRHGVLNLAMQTPDWAPASLIIISDACFTTLDMTELDRSLTHLRAAAIRCSFIIPSAKATPSTDMDFAPGRTPKKLLRALTSTPCISHVDLCQFIAHATAGFCQTGLPTDWHFSFENNSSQWNHIHELLLTLRLQDDVESTPEKEGDLGWLALSEMQPYSRVVQSALNHVLASRLKDGYRLRFVSAPSTDQNIAFPVTSSCSWIQIELALAWKPGVVFRLFLAGEWSLPIGQLPTSSSKDYLLQPIDKLTKGLQVIPGRYCIANLRVHANCSLLRALTQQRRDQVTSPYLASILDRFDFHLRLLNHVDDYLGNVSLFNLNPDIYSVPLRYRNGLCSVFITAQGASGGSEIYLSGNTAEVMEHDKSLSTFVHYWGRLLALDIANCYRWMHSETLYVALEHDSPLPSNLFVPVPSRRATDLLTCRQSLARIHSMLSDWCTLVLLENHTYIRLEYPTHDSLEDSSSPDTPDTPLHYTSSPVPCYFTLVRLEMKLPEMRVRVAFTAGVQSDYRRATLEQLSRRFRMLSFLPRGRQAVPKSRHKSGALGPLHPLSLSHPETVHVPPLQRTWGETPCCMVFLSQLDRLIVETGTWMSTRQQNYRGTTQPPSSNLEPSKSFLKGTVTQARCVVSPVLLRQHLCTSGCIWVAPLVSKSPNCVTKMFSTLVNLRIQEGFHFVRSGPQPGFVSMAREVMFSVDSAAEGAVKHPCLIQYQLYPFRVKMPKNDQSEGADDIQRASEAVQKVLDTAVTQVPKTFVNRLKTLTSAQLSSDIQIATEVWIEPKHGHTTDLPTEALYLANLPYFQVVERILQLDCFCLTAYNTLEKMLTACLLRMIELQRLAALPSPCLSYEGQSATVNNPTSTITSSALLTPAAALPFNLANIAAVCPSIWLLYPLLLDAFLLTNITAPDYSWSENIISRLRSNMTQRMANITPIPLSRTDSEQFSRFLVSEEKEENSSELHQILAASEGVEWQCFATVTSLIENISGSRDGNRRGYGDYHLPSLENLTENNVEVGASVVTFFLFPADMSSATSPFCQTLMNNLRQRPEGSTGLEASFPIIIYCCTHTYLSFPLDDRWTYNHPDKLVIDISRQNLENTTTATQSPHLLHRDELTSNPPESFLIAARGNPRLTKELSLLWTRLYDASLGLLNLCDEAFVECAYCTLLRGLVVPEYTMRSVLMSEQFCSPLPSITIDATDFLFSTCSHCFNAIRNKNQTSDSEFTFQNVRKRRSDICELRPNDSERISSRFGCLFNQYFSAVPQFPGFYYFRGGREGSLQPCDRLVVTQRCDSWPIPTLRSPSRNLTPSPNNPSTGDQKSGRLPRNRKAVFCTSSRSESDTDDAKKPDDDQGVTEKLVEGATTPIYSDMSQVPHKKPLFLKVVLKIKHASEEVTLPVESLPVCPLDVFQHCNVLSLQDFTLNVIFTPLVWKPEVKPSLEADVESSDHQGPTAIAAGPTGHLGPVEEVNESSVSDSGADSEEFSAFSEVGDEILNANVLQRPLPSSPLQLPLRRPNSMSSENFEDGDILCPLHWCECQLEVSETAGPCSICATLLKSEFFRYLDNEQWISLQRTTELFRWLLRDEVVCSQRLLQPLLVSTVEVVLRHMENTKSILMNIAPSTTVSMPFRVSHSNARLSKACTSGEGVDPTASDALSSLMSAIGWDSVNLEFVAKSAKSIPRFVERLQNISFRYAQAWLNQMGDYYVVCRAEPLSSQQEGREHWSLEGMSSQTETSTQIGAEAPSVFTRRRRFGLCAPSHPTGKDVESLRPFLLQSVSQSSKSYLQDEVTDGSVELESPTSKTCPSSYASIERQATMATTEAESEDTKFPLESHFPPQDSFDSSRQTGGPYLPPFWLIFRVGSASIQAFFHHSDTHRETTLAGEACPHCVVFRRSLDDIRSVVRLVSQSLLLDQLALDRLCDPALLPEPLEPQQRPPRHLQASQHPKRKLTPHFNRSPNLTVSASSATDSDNADLHPVANNPFRKKSGPSNDASSVPIDLYPPGSLACPQKFSFTVEVSPRAVIAGERGNQVLPEVRRLLENFAVMNRKNMFVFDDSDPTSDCKKLTTRRNLIPRIFYMLLREVPLESEQIGETLRKISNPNLPHRSGFSFPPGSNTGSLNRILLQAALYGISSPSRHFCNFVRTLLQSLLDKVVLECLQQVLSRTVLFRFAPHDFDFLFSRRVHQPRHQLFFTLPQFLTDSLKIPHVPTGSLILPFCQYLKQNLLSCMTAAKPEKEVLPCLRSLLGRGEVMLYYNRRGVGTAKFGLATVVVDLLHARTLEPFCITSFLILQEWLRSRGVENNLSVATVDQLTECLTDLHFSNDVPSSHLDRLTVRLRLWDRGEVDLNVLTEKIRSAVKNSIYDLIMEYFVLGLPACLVEVPVFKSQSSDMVPEPSVKAVVRSAAQFVPADTVRIPDFFFHSLLPWLGVATSTHLPLVIEKTMELASLQSIELLVGELVFQLNALIEERIGRPTSFLKCPLLTSSTSSTRGRRVKSTAMQQQFTPTTCSCQQNITFFAFESGNPAGDWVRFTKGRSYSPKMADFCQNKEFVIVGKNYALCRYQTALNFSSVLQTPPLEKVDEATSSSWGRESAIPVRQVACWSGRVPFQRHQTLDIQVQPLPDEANVESTTAGDDASLDTSCSTTFTLASDVPEFCEINLRLPQSLFNASRSVTPPTLDAFAPSAINSVEDSDGSAPCICVQVPRQTLCLLHLRGRQLRIYLYNWSRDDADRLLHRVECLVSWYNQRFQLLSCLSLQKTGLFHCLRTPGHLQLLKQAVHLSDHLCPPELTPSTMTAFATPSSSTAARSIRRRFLEGLVGSGAPLQPPSQPAPPPSQGTSSSAETPTPPPLPPLPTPLNASATLSAHSTSPATPATEFSTFHQFTYQQPCKAVGGVSRNSQDLNLTRIYQNCAKVPALGSRSPSEPEYLDVVHLHVDQAFRAIKNDQCRAEHLRLITAPLKAWMAGECFDVERYASKDPKSHSTSSPPPSTIPPVTAFYSAVKRFGRTLHTVCSPILFCPTARSEALRLREAEQAAEEGYPRLAKLEEQPTNIKEEEEGNEHVESLTMEGKSRAPGIASIDPASTSKALNRRRRSRPSSSTVATAISREQPSWMREATDCLLQEFITYMTRQMHFTVVLSTLDVETLKSELPYALLQRSVKMAGIHLLEVFIRDCVFCVRLKAIELCRLTRTASRAVITGPLAADLVGRAAAVAAVKITAAMIDPPFFASSGSNNTATIANVASASTSVCSSPYVVRWEESSRLCDCVHLHSFLYDFYLRNVDNFLKLQSDLIGHRMQVPSLTWALPQASKVQRRGGGGSFIASRHPFLPANYPILNFLHDLAHIVPLAPVFARGTFSRLSISLPVDARIKPEQVFEHLIEARQTYGLKVFDLGVNSNLPAYARFGFCSFSSPRRSSAGQKLSTQQTAGDNDSYTSSDAEMDVVESFKVPLPTEVEMGGATPPVPHNCLRPSHSTSTPRFIPQLRLPSLRHFSLACAAYFDKEAATLPKSPDGVESSTAPRYIGISVFVILTDQCRRFPRARLSSLPQGLPAEAKNTTENHHQTPLQWPAIRPGLSSDKDLNTLPPKLVRSGSHETTPALAGDSSSGLPMSLATSQRCRHTSCNIFGLGDSTAVTAAGARGTSGQTAPGGSTGLQHDPGLRWKISYLGVWPSHQIELRRALKLIHHAWYLSMPHIINSAILSCHKNLLWYRLFDPNYFPSAPSSALRSAPPLSNEEEVDEIGQEAVSLIFEVTHRGLSCDELQDLVNSAPLKMDLLRMDPRLVDLLRISGHYLTNSVVEHLNSTSGKTVAFLFNETAKMPEGWTHLVIIDPSFREGLIHVSWRSECKSALRMQDRAPRRGENQNERPPSVISRVSSVLSNILSPVGRPVEGVPFVETSRNFESSWRLCDLTMRAVFRSADSIETSTRNLSGSALAPSSISATGVNTTVLNFYRSQLMPVLKLLVEVLTLHVWRDLH